MKNITVTLPEHLERWLRTKAAEDGVSVSGWVRRLIGRARDRENHFRIAMASYFSGQPGRIDWPDRPNETKE